MTVKYLHLDLPILIIVVHIQRVSRSVYSKVIEHRNASIGRSSESGRLLLLTKESLC